MATIVEAYSEPTEIILDLLGKGLPLFRSVRSFLDLRKAVYKGIPYSSYESLRRQLHATHSELAALLLIAPRTLQRRKEKRRFTSEESDRILRLARIFACSIQVFGDREKAVHWLKSSIPALGRVSPWSLLDTDIGARNVEDLLGRIEFGVHS